MNRNNPTAFAVHITPHHLSLSPAIRDFVHTKLSKVPRFAADALQADIVLRRRRGAAPRKYFSASARLALPGSDIHASAEHRDLYTAIANLVTKLGRRSRQRKTRSVRTRATRAPSARRIHSYQPSNL